MHCFARLTRLTAVAPDQTGLATFTTLTEPPYKSVQLERISTVTEERARFDCTDEVMHSSQMAGSAVKFLMPAERRRIYSSTW